MLVDFAHTSRPTRGGVAFRPGFACGEVGGGVMGAACWSPARLGARVRAERRRARGGRE